MGYACPVCQAEQADAVHLANHFAVTASLGREDHLEWLEEHAPDWSELGPEALGEIVSEHAREIETPEFESGGEHGHAPSLESELAAQSQQPGRGSMDRAPSETTQGVLNEARKLTEQMHDSSGEPANEDDKTDTVTDDSSDT